MPRLATKDLARVRAIHAELGTLVTGATPALVQFMPELRDLLGTEMTIAYGLKPRGEGVAVDFSNGSAVDVGHVMEVFDDLLACQRVGWGTFNPIRPEPWQRNTIVTCDALIQRSELPFPPILAVYAKVGVAHHKTLRTLVCEGASLLGWVGAWQPDSFEPRQRRLLRALVPALRRRLILERHLAMLPRTLAALSAALERIGAAAFILGPRGNVQESNSAGRAMLTRDRLTLLGSLRDAALRRPSAIPFDLTPLRGAGEPGGYLAVARAERASTTAKVASVAARWSLTPRQVQILELVARGVSTRTLAAEIGIAERTVEFHLSAIFDKAGTDSRSALVARILTEAL